ncbi:amino acid ABC transporter membrane protein 2 (PAAT family) [Brevibacterium sanguinis]|uniref:Amino acid ABC transporter membrane protein 2 (PAAT family) n=2 Tax=Brevibacterium TaxID=1696 RepID=A0A366IFW7_9MICO|nr:MULTISPECIES: amino acid ABC transporter permease [Brevibacterium]RBP63577.1 amino acid ABC transporter membrane protein 2 (PAAT family) [Brevibacterium sanguinis]RBP70236.1 amino acid ABC transporter membrane protein 2 (PAAT family) [Brevibacterium celere]
MNDFAWLYDWPQYIPDLIPGLWVAIIMTCVSCLGGYVLGFFLALMVEAPSKIVSWTALILVELGRGIPILVLLFLFYQGLPQLGLLLDPYPAAVAALTFSAAGYSSEMIRAGLGAVPKGQAEAANSLSMSIMDTYRFIVIPQAARISIPPLVNLTIIIFQATSLATVITVPEIMQHAGIIGSASFEYMSVYTAAAVLYLCITIPGAVLSGYLEQRMGAPKQRSKKQALKSLLPGGPTRRAAAAPENQLIN